MITKLVARLVCVRASRTCQGDFTRRLLPARVGGEAGHETNLDIVHGYPCCVCVFECVWGCGLRLCFPIM